MKYRTPADERLAMKHPAAPIPPSSRSYRASQFASIVREMRSRHDIRVKKWRRSMSGCAWRVYHHDGQVINWIEAPLPRTPVSLAIFLHEIGHHVIGFERYKKRCEEEYHVWVWAIEQMQQFGVPVDQRVQRRFERSMQYAVDKAVRRGLKHLPPPLTQFLPQAA